jgi:AraC family transcriptional regulator
MQSAQLNTTENHEPSALLSPPPNVPVIFLVSDRKLPPSHPVGSSAEPALITTVQLGAASVRQQWRVQIPLVPEVPSSVPAHGISLRGASRAYQSVRFDLPRSTLDQYSDSHGLPRASMEEDMKVFHCPVLAGLAQLIVPSIDSPELLSASFMDHFVMLFCSQVIHSQTCGVEKQISRGGLSTFQRRRAVEMLSPRPGRNTTLSVVAKECRLSVSHFARSFKTSFGMSVHRWVVGQRVEMAKDLLLNSNEPLIEVAFLSCFSDQASLNRTFTKVTGTSPGRWRRTFKET